MLLRGHCGTAACTTARCSLRAADWMQGDAQPAQPAQPAQATPAQTIIINGGVVGYKDDRGNIVIGATDNRGNTIIGATDDNGNTIIN